MNSRKEYHRLYNIRTAPARRAQQRKWYSKNKLSICAKKRLYRLSHRDASLAAMKKWREKNKDQRRQYKSRYNAEYRRTAKYRLEHALRMRIWSAIRIQTKGTRKKSSKTMSLIGCSLPDLKIYLESKFDTGMTWENFGSVWHIDHIMPCAIFDLSKPEHQKRCFHFSNLQPLFASDNLKKGSKVTSNQYGLI